MVFETFAERKRRQNRRDAPEVYIYDRAPAQLRHQISLALAEGLGSYTLLDRYGLDSYEPDNAAAYECWKQIDYACHKEIFSFLTFRDDEDFKRGVLAAIADCADIDDWLSIVEICCKIMDWLIGTSDIFVDQPERVAATNALSEINRRFEQHCVGYQFENGQIIRKDSQLVHSEVVKPALALLAAPLFAKANDDFMTAHRHYRNGEFKDAVTAANRAFETTLKLICDLESWAYGKGDRASELVTVVSNNGLFTHYFDKGLSAYMAMLKTGLPNVRNDAGGHGAGLAAQSVTAGIARYAINLTASNIVFLGDAYAAFNEAKGKRL
jgi:hypothetical protein